MKRYIIGLLLLIALGLVGALDAAQKQSIRDEWREAGHARLD